MTFNTKSDATYYKNRLVTPHKVVKCKRWSVADEKWVKCWTVVRDEKRNGGSSNRRNPTAAPKSAIPLKFTPAKVRRTKSGKVQILL